MHNLQKRCLILGVLVLGISHFVIAQNPINFTSITTKEGLSSNTINAELRDRFGLMWFGTTNGLTKYDGSNFVTYRHDAAANNSLPSNEILTLFEDRSGKLWIATGSGGLCFYDRKFDRFIQFKGNGSWPELTGTSIRAITQDHKGRLWIGTYKDLRMIDLHNGSTTRLPIYSPDNNDIGTFVVLSIFEDSRQRMWVGTNNGLYLYDWVKNSFTRYAHEDNAAGSISSNTVKAIAEDVNGGLWFGTYDGVNRWMDGHFSVLRHNNQDPESLSDNTIFALCPTPDGKIWIGTENGISIADAQAKSFQRLKTDPRNGASLKSNSIRSIYLDPDGIFWVGTFRGGICKYNRHLALFNQKQSDQFDPVGLKSPLVTAFAQDSRGRILVGTDGAGVAVFDKTTGFLYPRQLQSKLKRHADGLSVLSMYTDKKGNTWVGTYHDGVFCIDRDTKTYKQFVADGTAQGLSSNDISYINEDTYGRIWFGTLGHGINVYNTASHQMSRLSSKMALEPGGERLPLNDFIGAITVGADGRVWIGSLGTGIAVYNPSTKTFLHYNKANNRLVDNIISNILVARDNSIWIATNNGISHFDPIRKAFDNYGEREGLANCSVKVLLEDKDGLLWLSTDRGITSFDSKKIIFRNFTDENGVQQGAFLTGAGLKSTSGELYFGGQDGFNYFNPARLPATNLPGRVMLTDLKVGNESVNPGDKSPIKEEIDIAKEIVLHHGQNFAISYVALDYTSAKQNAYAYKLEGFDKNWNFVHKGRTASYTNLDPGTYEFAVQASSNDKLWNNPVTRIKVIVLPPFWRTIYAYVLYVLLIGAALLLMRRRGIEKIRRQFKQEQEKLYQSQLIEQERREAERLRELDNLKIKFFTDLSHEFRTPVSLILAPVEKLLEKSFEQEDTEHLLMINRNGRRLLNLVNQLLDFRKMEEQTLKINWLPGDIVRFIIEAAEAFQDLAIHKQISLNIESDCEHFTALFDPDKLERIVFNLLSNAFKFTPANGAIDISVHIVNETHGSTTLILGISDTGVGIQPADLNKIYDRFYQSKQDKAMLNQGTGIGLSITKEFVEMHNGVIDVTSKPSEGSTFTVTIPLVAVSALPENASDAPPEITDDQTAAFKLELDNIGPLPTILLVEDNDEFRHYLAGHLKQYYQIIEASNGREGWQKTLSAHPQLVVTDISMPYMNGTDLCKKIKGDKRTSHTPVILLTAMTGEEEQLHGLQTGANDYLTKPFNFQILQTKISNLLDLNRNLKDTYSKQIQIIDQQVEVESADVKLLNMIMKYIEMKMSDPELSVEELSKHVGMSRGSLYYKLIELTGLSPVEYVRNVKLDKAAALLEASDYNIAQIAYLTGFGAPSYFSRMFKARFRILPSEYISVKRQSFKSKNPIINVPA